MDKVDRFPSGSVEDELQGLFDSAHGDGFEPPEVEALWQRLVVLLAMPMPQPTGATGGAGSGWLSAGGVKGALALVIGGVAAAGIVAGVHAGIATSTRAPSAPPAVVSDAPPPAAEPPSMPSLPEPEATVVVPPAAPAIASNAANVPVDHGKSTPHAKALAASRHATGTSPLEPAPAPVTSPGAAQDTSSGSPVPAMTTRTSETPAAAAAPVHINPAAATPAPSEAGLLLRGRRALASDPATTFALTEEAARQYPRGDLAPEREVLAIEALAALKRHGEARTRLDAFERRYPGSLPIARLERLLAE